MVKAHVPEKVRTCIQWVMVSLAGYRLDTEPDDTSN